MFWKWNDSAKRYTVTKEGAAILGRRAGTFVSVDTLNDGREKFIDHQKQRAQKLVGDLVEERTNMTQWVLNMREELKQVHLAQYMLAKGGKNNMTQADYGRVGAVLREQYQYLNNFASDIVTRDLSEAQIRARMNLYFNNSNASFERGRAASHGLQLPAYPADGATQCKSNCKCRWDIQEKETEWHCYWRLGEAEHCDDCVSNAGVWSPLVVGR